MTIVSVVEAHKNPLNFKRKLFSWNVYVTLSFELNDNDDREKKGGFLLFIFEKIVRLTLSKKQRFRTTAVIVFQRIHISFNSKELFALWSRRNFLADSKVETFSSTLKKRQCFIADFFLRFLMIHQTTHWTLFVCRIETSFSFPQTESNWKLISFNSAF